MGPSLRLPAHLRLSPTSWRLFWSMEIPAKALYINTLVASSLARSCCISFLVSSNCL
ncbi:hypothetical protein HMPREF1544_10188 [Mucor circinelloides 1006PhL]|uniref:Uncharacterized protein n=1 Tax=Mucor circinelloides f. circinelloides (strain 1006PhL) TaxID=1220926 RepID=S2IZ41_MUCC1|nr:hypothetical protein HMPREF1544_10188 [Mucor circinelloides 1006PhL]